MKHDKDKDFLSVIKRNSISLAKHHKKYCEGESCDISLSLLEEMCEKLGVEFTKDIQKQVNEIKKEMMTRVLVP